MAKEPDNIDDVWLREIRVRLEELSTKLDAIEARMQHVETRFEQLGVGVAYSLGPSPETQFRQTKPGLRIDELFAQPERTIAVRRQ